MRSSCISGITGLMVHIPWKKYLYPRKNTNCFSSYIGCTETMWSNCKNKKQEQEKKPILRQPSLWAIWHQTLTTFLQTITIIRVQLIGLEESPVVGHEDQCWS